MGIKASDIIGKTKISKCEILMSKKYIRINIGQKNELNTQSNENFIAGTIYLVKATVYVFISPYIYKFKLELFLISLI